MQEYRLKSARFRAERAASWDELERLLDALERGGARRLSGDALMRLPVLYRGAVSSLSVARAVSLDRNLLEYLESLVGRAYFAVYARPRSPGEAAWRFLARDFPRTVRRFGRYLALSAALLALGTLAGALLTLTDPDRYYAMVPEVLAQQRNPASTTDELLDVLYHDRRSEAPDALDETLEVTDELSVFAAGLFSNNAGVGIMAFALGFAAGAPTLYLLFYNGLILGAFAGLYHGRAIGLDFWAWVLPHGVTELLAVCLCGAAGLAIGAALVFPDERGRMVGLAERGRQAAIVVAGSILLFFLAALIEGFFRQLVGDVGVRWSVAAATAVGWTLYLGRAGRGAAPTEDDGVDVG